MPLVTSTNGLPEKNPFSSTYSANCTESLVAIGVVSREPDGKMPLFSLLHVSNWLFEKLSTVIFFGCRWSWFGLVRADSGAAAPSLPAQIRGKEKRFAIGDRKTRFIICCVKKRNYTYCCRPFWSIYRFRFSDGIKKSIWTFEHIYSFRR